MNLSPNIVNALIATEDVRFTEHSGIDAKALIRAVVKRGLLMQKNAGGGSTLCTTARQAIVYGRSCEKYVAAPVSEADRVGDCRKTGTLLYQRKKF